MAGHRAVTTSAVVLLLAAVGAAPATAATTDVVRLRFDDVAEGSAFGTLRNHGTAAGATVARVVAADGGRVVAVRSVAGQGRAGDLPGYSATGPRALVAIVNTTSADPMSPGTRRLEFGADLTLDAGVTAGGGGDNGNNAVQRGLWGDGAQFKLEVDRNRPTCRVEGAAGAAQVTSRRALATDGTRYRVRCVRSAGSDRVTLTVTTLRADGSSAGTVSDSATGRIGPVDFARTVPMTIGGKAYWSGSAQAVRLLSASDQYNGTVDNAMLRIG